MHESRFVAVDLAACIVVRRAGLQRCFEVAFQAPEPAEPAAAAPTGMLRGAYAALDRVLAAHVALDPSVEAVHGVTDLFRWLASRNATVVGLAPFAPAVARALVARFGWKLRCESVVGDGAALYAHASRIAHGLGYVDEEIAFVTDDALEIRRARDAACGTAIHLGSARARSFDDVARILGARPRALGATELHG